MEKLKNYLNRESNKPIKYWWFLAYTFYLTLQGMIVGVCWTLLSLK